MSISLIKRIIERSQKYKTGVQKMILHSYFVRISAPKKGSGNDSAINFDSSNLLDISENVEHPHLMFFYCFITLFWRHCSGKKILMKTLIVSVTQKRAAMNYVIT